MEELIEHDILYDFPKLTKSFYSFGLPRHKWNSLVSEKNPKKFPS
jgi:hypothetical protein